jgi:hypothetical protein
VDAIAFAQKMQKYFLIVPIKAPERYFSVCPSRLVTDQNEISGKDDNCRLFRAI